MENQHELIVFDWFLEGDVTERIVPTQTTYGCKANAKAKHPKIPVWL